MNIKEDKSYSMTRKVRAKLRGREDTLENGVATHSSILLGKFMDREASWAIEEPGGLHVHRVAKRWT